MMTKRLVLVLPIALLLISGCHEAATSQRSPASSSTESAPTPEPSSSPSPAPAPAPAPTATPDSSASWPHIYVHYDYMVSNGPAAHSHAPSDEAIQEVVDVFRDHGIVLDIDPVHTAIPESLVTTIDPNNSGCTGPDTVDISALKKKYYTPRNPEEHYAVFAHYNTCGSDAECAKCDLTLHLPMQPEFGSTGISQLPGHDFIVSLGSFVDYGISPIPPTVDGGTFMHELGHNLGLRHGGDDDVLRKPNYISVMNYTYQFGIGVVDPGTRFAASTTDPSARYVLNYSEQALPSLHEGKSDGRQSCIPDGTPGMDETTGLNTGRNYVAVYWTAFGSTPVYAPTDGSPIDWNFDGSSSETSAYGDITGDSSCDTLHGFDDWSAIKAYLVK